MDQEIRQRDVNEGARPAREARAGLRAALDKRGLVQEIGIVAVGALALASIEAFGLLAEESWYERLAYWLRTTTIIYAVHRLVVWKAARTAVRLDLPEWGGWIAGTMIAAAPGAAWLWWLGPVVDLGRQPPSFAQFLETYGQVLIPAAIVLFVLWIIRGSPGERRGPALPGDQEPPPAPLPPHARLIDRLPGRLRADLVAIGVEDHYVRVFTRLGDTLLLMRLSDAIAETEGVEGLQVHRSWWVACASITSIERRGRTALIKLDTGLSVPVARRRIAQLRRLIDQT